MPAIHGQLIPSISGHYGVVVTTISAILTITLCLVPTVALAITNKMSPHVVQNHIIDLESIPSPPWHSYDYTEPIENPGPIETKVIFSETYSTPRTADPLLDNSVQNNRVIYGQRILETLVPGSRIYWNEWNGVYQAIKSTVLHVVALKITVRLCRNYALS